MLMVFQKEVIHELLHLLDIPIVDGNPCLLYDLVYLDRISCVSARLVRSVRVCWSLYRLHGLCVLLFDNPADGSLSLCAMELGC